VHPIHVQVHVGQKSVECHALPEWSITFTSFPQRKRSVKCVGMSPSTVPCKYSVVLYWVIWLLTSPAAKCTFLLCAALQKLPLLLLFEVVCRCLIALWNNRFNPNEVKDEVVPMNAMKSNGGMNVYLHLFLTLTLDGCKWSYSRHSRFISGVGAPVTHSMGGCIGSGGDLDNWEKS
jgi:hypothetical protein